MSILCDIDFELELIHRDEINVTYILKLLAKLKDATEEEQEKQKKAILDIMTGDARLRSKRELIDRFIQENLPLIEDSDDIPEVFNNYLTKEKVAAIEKLSTDENLDSQKLEQIIGSYLFTEKTPFRDEVISSMNVRPALKERRNAAQRVTDKIVSFVDTYISGFAGV